MTCGLKSLRWAWLALFGLSASVLLASTDPVQDVRQILAGTVTTKATKNAYLSGAKDGSPPFQGALAAYKAVRAAEPVPTVTCADGTVVKAPGACPVVQPPAPLTTLPYPSPNGLKGEIAIPDNFTGGIVSTNGTGAIPPHAAASDLSAFRMFCGPGWVARFDPLVMPGQPSHLHQGAGNTGVAMTSNYASLRTTGQTTCGDPATPLNRSAYWIPAMLDGVGHVVKPDFLNLYYKRADASSPDCIGPAPRGICIDLPNGLRYVFGYNFATGLEGITDPNSAAYWLMTYNCNDSEDHTISAGAAAGLYHTLKDVADHGCPVGAQVIVVGFAEDCWDGVNLDTPDHRSHMAYASVYDGTKMVCDPKHPYLIPDMQFQWHFTVDANLKTWHLSSDEMVPGAIAGSTLHMDYWEAWSPTAKATWEQYCINGHLTCASGDLGNGTSIAGAGIPAGGFPVHQLVPIP